MNLSGLYREMYLKKTDYQAHVSQSREQQSSGTHGPSVLLYYKTILITEDMTYLSLSLFSCYFSKLSFLFFHSR